MSETPRMDKARFHGSIHEGRDVLVAIPLPTSQAQRIWKEGCKLERELRQAEIGEFQEHERAEKTERELAQAQARCAELEKLLRRAQPHVTSIVPDDGPNKITHAEAEELRAAIRAAIKP